MNEMHHVATPENVAYIFNLLRSFDNENYVANLLQPTRRVRIAHAVTRALNVEFDRVRATVSNEDLARLRLSFFRSALLSIIPSVDAETSPNNSILGSNTTPVIDCLAQSISDFPHTNFTPLYDLLSAREEYLSFPNFTHTSKLQKFAAAPHIPLITIHTSLLHNKPSPLPTDAASAIEPAATAVGLAVLLRAVPFHAMSRLSYMPRNDLATSDLLTANSKSVPVFRSVAQTAEQHAAYASRLVAQLPRSLRPAFWPIHLATMYLARLAAAKYDPFDGRLTAGVSTTWHLAVQIRLLRARYLHF